jgi:hypothetical protein
MCELENTGRVRRDERGEGPRELEEGAYLVQPALPAPRLILKGNMMKKVKDLLTNESKWTQGAPAREADGGECSVNSPGAVSYCLLGAVYAVCGCKTRDSRRAIVKLAVAAGLPVDIPDARLIIWNDDGARTFEEVRSVIEKADV